MATLSDIAKKCGVSTAAVSYVLNGQGDKRRISREMQEEIKAAAIELEYKVRKSEHKHKNIRIGCFWPAKNLETMIPNIVEGINLALQFETEPVDISIHPYEYNALGNADILWNGKNFDVAVIYSPNTADIQALEKNRPRIPAVIVNRQLESYCCVGVDYGKVGRLVAEQAIARGGDDIVLVRNVIPHLGMNRRSQAIYDVCHSYGINIDTKVLYCNNGADDGYEIGHKLMGTKKLPRVIMSVYDTAAFGMVRAFNEAGAVVGRDIDIITTGTSYAPFFAKCSPSITVVDMKIAEASQRAIRVAVGLATGRLSEPDSILIEPEMIYRESSPIPTHEQTLKFIELKRRIIKAGTAQHRSDT